MKVLFVGGTGEISQACVMQAIAAGHDVSVFNRGLRDEPLPAGVTAITGDFRDAATYRQLGDSWFDVVCQFLIYEPEMMLRDIEVFSGSCAQYVFVSTASVYQKPMLIPVITEAVPCDNPYWAYSRSKIECEALLGKAPLAATIVRPSHTYRRRLPSTLIDGDHLAWRLTQGKPVIVHDDGNSPWTLTHASDFARAFTGLLGNSNAVGTAVHITSDDAPVWNTILRQVAESLGVTIDLVPVASAQLIGFNTAWTGTLLGDKANPMRFDNSRIRGLVPDWKPEIDLATGIGMAAGFARDKLAAGYEPDPELDQQVDRIIADVRSHHR